MGEISDNFWGGYTIHFRIPDVLYIFDCGSDYYSKLLKRFPGKVDAI